VAALDAATFERLEAVIPPGKPSGATRRGVNSIIRAVPSPSGRVVLYVVLARRSIKCARRSAMTVKQQIGFGRKGTLAANESYVESGIEPRRL
jgi:hypothetical protein